MMTLAEVLQGCLGVLAVYYFYELNATSKKVVEEMHLLHVKLTEIAGQVKTQGEEIKELKTGHKELLDRVLK